MQPVASDTNASEIAGVFLLQKFGDWIDFEPAHKWIGLRERFPFLLRHAREHCGWLTVLTFHGIDKNRGLSAVLRLAYDLICFLLCLRIESLGVKAARKQRDKNGLNKKPL